MGIDKRITGVTSEAGEEDGNHQLNEDEREELNEDFYEERSYFH